MVPLEKHGLGSKVGLLPVASAVAQSSSQVTHKVLRLAAGPALFLIVRVVATDTPKVAVQPSRRREEVH